jgi:hypothetical protein
MFYHKQNSTATSWSCTNKQEATKATKPNITTKKILILIPNLWDVSCLMQMEKFGTLDCRVTKYHNDWTKANSWVSSHFQGKLRQEGRCCRSTNIDLQQAAKIPDNSFSNSGGKESMITMVMIRFNSLSVYRMWALVVMPPLSTSSWLNRWCWLNPHPPLSWQ